MKENKALLFDLDGTLLDSRETIIEAAYRTADELVPGVIDRAELIRCFGEPMDQFVARLVQAAPVPLDSEVILATYVKHVQQLEQHGAGLFPGVADGLAALRMAGYQMAIVTNKQRELAIRDLQRTGILHLFEQVVTLSDVQAGKPSPEMLHKAMDLLGVESGQAKMIGDSWYDWQAACTANVPCIILDWYEGEGLVWKHIPNVECFRGFDELLECLGTVRIS